MTVLSAAPSASELLAERNADRIAVEAERKALGARRLEVDAAYKRDKAKLGPRPFVRIDRSETEAHRQWDAQYDAMQTSYEAALRDFEARGTDLGRRWTETGNDIAKLRPAAVAERKRAVDAEGAGDIAKLTKAVADIEQRHHAAVAASAAVPGLRQAAIIAGDTEAARQAAADADDLPITSKVLCLELIRARLALERARLADAAKAEDGTAQSEFDEAQRMLAEAERRRAAAHERLRQAARVRDRHRQQVAALESELARQEASA